MTLSRPVAATEDAEADLLLVLAVDTSGSMSEDRLDLQIDGYAGALESPEFATALQSGRLGRIALSFVQWSSPDRQDETIGWTLVSGGESALRFAARLRAAWRPVPGTTAIGDAIDFCARLIAACPWHAARRVIDISGDGTSNEGRDLAEARDAAIAAGITINGLPILATDETLGAYYAGQVIGGPGAFLVIARNMASFSEAVLRKLVNEVAAR